MGRTAGVVAVKPGDEATGEEPCILFVHLRWTRSGFKALMHVMNGADKPHGGGRAMGNCTDEELAFFLGEGGKEEAGTAGTGTGTGTGAGNDGGDGGDDVDHQVARLWNSPLVPVSWTKDKGPAALTAAHAVYPTLASKAREERRRRAGGGGCRRDALSKASLQLPKGAVDPGETPWNAALRELQEEAGVEASEVRRAEAAPGIRAGPMTAFVVTLGEERTAGAAGAAGVGSGWKVEGSPETVSAVWVPVSQVAPGPLCAVHHVRQVKEVLDKVLPNLNDWVPSRARAGVAEEDEEREGAKRARLL
jgi:8-oxo-dGTP pyrophosphatase MutT (NUDIX family)